MNHAIKIAGLDKRVKVGFWGKERTLLSGVTFDVPVGATVGFVGANGAGKSTTMKHIIGASRPTAGTVQVFGVDPTLPAARKKLGYMPELPFVPPTLTAREIARLHAVLCDVNDAARVGAVLDLAGLAQHQDERVGGFSKGMQTRLCLALALLPDPDLLVLDEPMSGLDPVGRQLVRQLLQDERARKKTILFSSHVLSDVEALCDHVVAIDKGRIVFSGTTSSALGPVTDRATVRATGGDAPPHAPGIRGVTREGDTWVVAVAERDALDVAVELRRAGLTVLSVEATRPRLEERLVGWISGSSS